MQIWKDQNLKCWKILEVIILVCVKVGMEDRKSKAGTKSKLVQSPNWLLVDTPDVWDMHSAQLSEVSVF